EIESADSVAKGAVEVGWGAAGHDGGAGRERRRLQIRDRDLAVDAREGNGDPLAGAVVRGDDFTPGRFTARRGPGLAGGVPEGPWRAGADAGARAPRARSLEGVALRRGPLEAFAGVRAKRGLAGVRVRRGATAFGVLAAAHGTPIASLALAR